MKNPSCLAICIAAILTGMAPASAQNCTEIPSAADFTVETLGNSPGMGMDIAVAKDLKVYWVERHGDFKVWNPSTKAVTVIKHFDAMYNSPGASQYYKAVEGGLEGLALDPDFATNHWIYLWWSPKVTAGSQHGLWPIERLSRFTLKNNDGEVDMATEKPILESKIYAQCCHHGGDLEWGPDGNLWITTGDNTHYDYSSNAPGPFREENNYSDTRSTSANTNDLRGKILRIKLIRFPDTQTPAIGVGSTYEIPAGNLRDTWATSEKDKVRPEIYTMGHRNPFSISIHPDPAKLWVGIGEAGGAPAGKGEDEINLATKPGNFGWPYFNGNNVPYFESGYPGPGNPFSNPAAVVNESKHNSGAKTLPPAVPALISPNSASTKLGLNCLGVTWGWVKYDASNGSKAQWPESLKNRLLVSSHGASDLMAVSLDETGRVAKMDRLFTGAAHTTDIMRAHQGPDGAFYVTRGDGLNFGTSSASKVFRIAYKGTCVTSARPDEGRVARHLSERPRFANLGGSEVILPPGIVRAEVYDLSGRVLWTVRRQGGVNAEFSAAVPASVPRGMLQLRYFAR